MYMTVVAGSPCAKTVSFPWNLCTFLPRPAESRNSCTSNAGLLLFAFWGERRTLRDTRRAFKDAMLNNSIEPDFVDCPKEDSLCQSAWRPQPVAEQQQVLRIQGIYGCPSVSAELSEATGALLILIPHRN